MSERSEWRRFVERRRRELHDLYPCAAPSRHRWCSKHDISVPAFSGICTACRDELYEQLDSEYASTKKKSDTDETPLGLAEALRALTLSKGRPSEADRPPIRPMPGRKHKPLPGQLDLYGNETPGRKS